MKNIHQLTAGFLCLLSASTCVSAAQHGGDYYGPHMMMWDGMFMAPIMMIAFLAVAVVVVVLIVRWLGGGPHGATLRPPAERDPLDILKERFARGEIEKEEFEERRRLLREK